MGLGAVPPSCHLSSLRWEVFLPDASLTAFLPTARLSLFWFRLCSGVLLGHRRSRISETLYEGQ